MIWDFVAAILFVCSSGILFNERFRRNWLLVGIAGCLALLSTYILTDQIVQKAVDERIGGVRPGGNSTGVSHALGSVLDNAGQQIQKMFDPPTPPPDVVSQDEVQSVFNDYLAAWQRGDVDAQANLLSDDFVYVDQDKQQSRADYVAQKQRLAGKYAAGGQISVLASDVKIEAGSPVATVTYTQTYRNPSYWSIGTNRFTLRKIGGTTKIIEERFQRTSYGTP